MICSFVRLVSKSEHLESNKLSFFVVTALFPPQSTVVVLQALSEYLIHKPPPADLSLDVDVKMTGRRDVRYHFNPHTAYMARSSRVRRATPDGNNRAHVECCCI